MLILHKIVKFEIFVSFYFKNLFSNLLIKPPPPKKWMEIVKIRFMSTVLVKATAKTLLSHNASHFLPLVILLHHDNLI